MAVAVIWHYWIGVVFFVLSLVVVLAVIAGYFVRVQSLKYPKRSPRLDGRAGRLGPG